MSGSPPQERTQNEKIELPLDLARGAVYDARVPQDAAAPKAARPLERGGPAGLEPTRYGDWERAGRCIDF
jgi:hypothetical protein